MVIDWVHFTPWASLGGGLVLGLAAAMFILLNGRILGISGILGGLLLPRLGDIGWRISFLLGMAAAPTVFVWLAPADFLAAPRIEAGYVLIVAAGHGVCGLSRLSPRSLAATLTFMGAGFAIVFVVRHLF